MAKKPSQIKKPKAIQSKPKPIAVSAIEIKAPKMQIGDLMPKPKKAKK